MQAIKSILIAPAICLSLAACSSKPKDTNSTNPATSVATKVELNENNDGGFNIRPYSQTTLPNGLKILFVHDPSLPRVSLQVLIKAGNTQETAAKAGLNAMTAYLLEQGTQKRNATAIADELGQMGSGISVDASSEFTTVSADALSLNAEQLLEIFADVVMAPSFQDAEVKRIKTRVLAGLKKKIDDPSSFADEQMASFFFGDEHPYGRDINGTIASVTALKKQDLIKHYLTFYRPNNSTLAVVGKFDQGFESKVSETFKAWSQRKIPEVTVAAVKPTEKLQVKLVIRKNLEQTQIRVAHAGIDRLNPDFLRLRVANETLGGGFASRLNQKIRDDKGLTYSIYSYFDVRKYPGTFAVSTFTKNETAGQTLTETLNVVNEFVQQGSTKREFLAAKSQLIGKFPRSIETADRLAYNLLVLDFYGIPFSYLTNYNKEIQDISADATKEAMNKVIANPAYKVLVYGNESIIPQFEKFNPEIVRIK